ncbi:hypothetical protein CEXT_599251 [Caerostris extrusa]|uniref:Uncharacterized protein n=1 Tax=Caerostris extrusa TaxID=172846 RepID=A0AAV4SA72_CAEEX|nr:hypothetical protein CEXT_599251 [Caerostris extrusa]
MHWFNLSHVHLHFLPNTAFFFIKECLIGAANSLKTPKLNYIVVIRFVEKSETQLQYASAPVQLQYASAPVQLQYASTPVQLQYIHF